MKHDHIFILIILLIFSFSAAPMHAEPTPRWVKKGVKELEKKRSNDSYSFHIFRQEEDNKRSFEIDQFKPLLEYVDSVYQVAGAQLVVDSIPADGILPTTYIVTFEKDGTEQSVFAQKVDSYQKIEDYPDGSYDYNLSQLYAISNPGFSTPDFDKFILKRNYGAKPLLMSIIPGLGQIYKGDTAKGYAFLGVEAAMVASIIYASERAHHWSSLGNKYPDVRDSYDSKAKSFRDWRMFCFIAGGGLYIYNLLDAAFAKGARYVEVERNNAPNMQISFGPVVTPDMLGVGVNINL